MKPRPGSQQGNTQPPHCSCTFRSGEERLPSKQKCTPVDSHLVRNQETEYFFLYIHQFKSSRENTERVSGASEHVWIGATSKHFQKLCPGFRLNFALVLPLFPLSWPHSELSLCCSGLVYLLSVYVSRELKVQFC